MRVTIILLIISILLAGFFACTKIGDLKSRDNPLDPNGINPPASGGGTIDISKLTGTIVFCSSRDGNSEVYKINANGTELTRLTTTSENEDHPKWSNNGDKITYSRRLTASQWEIFTMNQDGTGQKQISTNSAWSITYASVPVFSPDDNYIYYRGYNSSHYKVYRINANGGNKTLILDESGSGNDPCIKSISLDGKIYGEKVVGFADGSDNRIFKCNLDGSGLIYFTHNNRICREPMVNKQGTKLVYFDDVIDGQNYKVFTINVDGTGMTKIFDDPACQYVGSPAWSPDGNYIIFSYYKTGNYRLYIMKSDGTCVTPFTTGAGSYNDEMSHWK